MKICGVVVLYNPNDEVIKNIKTYISYLDELVIFDNSSKKYQNINELNKYSKVKYISYEKNLGIARALKESLDYAIEQKYDWCLTMDQDSKININEKKFKEILHKLENKDEYGIISFDYNNKHNDTELSIREAKAWITSGNFVNISNYINIEKIDERLFIDFVDYDLCEKFKKAGYKIGIMNYSIIHNIGNPVSKKILGFRISSMNHSPIRYYYRYRNCVYLFNKNKKYYFKKIVYEFIVNLPKMLLIEKNRKSKLKMIFKGIKDGLKQKLGEYEKEKTRK